MRPLALQHRSFISATFAVPEPQTLGAVAGRQCQPPVPAGEPRSLAQRPLLAAPPLEIPLLGGISAQSFIKAG